MFLPLRDQEHDCLIVGLELLLIDNLVEPLFRRLEDLYGNAEIFDRDAVR